MIDIGLPIIVRPAYTLGGRGGGIARTPEEFRRIVRGGLDASPISQILLDESVIGWGEFELEVMRDHNDNCVIVCSIENIDPMGVHTGDSVTVAPQQTLTDRLYQQLRDQAFTVIRAVGVETGGSNVQFAVNPETEEIMVIEMNPRVSRSSALASKATGFPIAKIAARLAVGYALEEIDNDITRADAGVLRADDRLRRREVAALRVREVRGLRPAPVHAHEVRRRGDGDRAHVPAGVRQGDAQPRARRDRRASTARAEELLARLETPGPRALRRPARGLPRGRRARGGQRGARTSTSGSCASCRRSRWTRTAPFAGTRSYRAVDTCAAEFAAETPYFYSGWERDGAARATRSAAATSRASSSSAPGPNRIGQGIEFDYCCVHAAMTVRASGRDAVMINCNPETVSTDYDTSDRLYFEPLTLEDVLGVVEIEQPEGVIVQFGGQTPLKLAAGLQDARRADPRHERRRDRPRRGPRPLRRAARPPRLQGAAVRDGASASARRWRPARRVGFPLLVRPSYVLGGRAMEIVYDERRTSPTTCAAPRLRRDAPPREIFLDRFLENAIELDVDALCDGEDVWIGGIMQHVEEAGIHSGDSACVLPPHSLGPEMLEEIRGDDARDRARR